MTGAVHDRRPGAAPRECFRRAARIRRRAEFQRVYDEGLRVRGRFLTVFFLPNGRSLSRLGLAVSRRFGGAVQRNRAKRLIREMFRRHPRPAGLDIVLSPRSDLIEGSFAHLEADYLRILKQSRRRQTPERA